MGPLPCMSRVLKQISAVRALSPPWREDTGWGGGGVWTKGAEWRLEEEEGWLVTGFRWRPTKWHVGNNRQMKGLRSTKMKRQREPAVPVCFSKALWFSLPLKCSFQITPRGRHEPQKSAPNVKLLHRLAAFFFVFFFSQRRWRRQRQLNQQALALNCKRQMKKRRFYF